MSGYFADTDGRRAFIDGLRELADFLDAHPDVPAPKGIEEIQLCTWGSDEEKDETVRLTAAAMGVTPQSGRNGLRGGRRFGPIEFFVLAIPQAQMDEHHAVQDLGKRALAGQRVEAVASR